MKKVKQTFFYNKKGILCFRFYGYGLLIKDTRKQRLYFSERHGYSGGKLIGKFFIELLKPVEL